MNEIEIGVVDHFYGHIPAATFTVKCEKVSVGDTIKIIGHGHEFTQQIEEMQIDRQNIQEAKQGDAVGIKVLQKVKPGDKIYKIVE
ncbi:MAG: translation elongation factor-like protein [Elusimicrobiota bacterium]